MQKDVKGWDYLSLALLAFGGLGLEAVLGFLIEPFLYGTGMEDWSTLQNIAHWIVTCVLWGVVSFLLVKYARKKYGFDIFEEKGRMRLWQWGVAVVVVIGMLMISYFDWGGSKVIKEFQYNGWLKFIFQYIYYLFETIVFTLIIVFGQKACEQWFHKKEIPFGGIAVALTWGLGHIFTKGSVAAGILTAISGFAFGSIYLLVNRDIRKTYILSFIMFVL